ncbi:MAG: rhomboid family intramembrane serine protease [Hyphomicrobiaceae bacterium]
MFVPLHDENPLRHISRAYVTIGLIVVNCVAFLMEFSPVGRSVVASLAVIPSELFAAGPLGSVTLGPVDQVAIPEGLTLITYMFLHGDPAHLIGNMLFLWVFGDNVEDAMGHVRFLFFYFICGVVGGLVHAYAAEYGGAGAFIDDNMTRSAMGGVPLVGASAAVAGVIAAYLMLHPRVRVWVLAFRFIPLRISALLALGAWIATQFAMLLLPDTGPVAWWAHIGGIACGALLIIFLRRPGVPLFDKPSATLTA